MGNDVLKWGKTIKHYRESVREQRLKEQQHYEQQIKQLELTHRYLLQDNHELKKSLNSQHVVHGQLSEDYKQLQETYYQTKIAVETAAQQLQQFKHENTAQTQQIDEQKVRYEALTKKSEQQQESLIISYHQLKLIKQKMITKEKQCKKHNDQNQQLIHKKTILEQETAQLKSSLGQLSK